jgi:hypothetical protein
LAIDEPLMSHCEKPTTRERQAPNVWEFEKVCAGREMIHVGGE